MERSLELSLCSVPRGKSSLGGHLLIFSYIAESYLETEEGQREAERAKREGSRLYLEAKKRILRPEVAGGAMGLGEWHALQI